MSSYLGDKLINGAEQFVGESRNIGQIIPSTIPLTDAGLHLLDGALIQGSGIYSAFVTYIAGLVSTYPDLFVTEADWQTAVTTYGVCGKFVYDSVNNTVRLPKYGTQIITKTPSVASTVPIRGNGMTLGLTRGGVNYGMAAGNGVLYYQTSVYGANTNTGAGGGINAGNVSIGVTSNSSKSGIIAVTSSLLTDYPLDCYYYIVIATSTKTDIEVDIDEVVTDLNGKADTDFSNVTNTANIIMAKASMPSNSYINLTIGAAGTAYTAPEDGWYWCTGTSGYIYLTNQSNGMSFMCQLNNGVVGHCYLPVKKGDVVTLWWSGSTMSTFYFFYAVGSEAQ